MQTGGISQRGTMGESRMAPMAGTNESVGNFASINKSLGKLDQIHKMNWSQKDQNLSRVATHQLTFRRWQATTDPRVFKMEKSSKIKTSTRKEATPITTFYSTLTKRPMTCNVSSELHAIGAHLNYDNKLSYLKSLQKKTECTNTLLSAAGEHSRAFGPCDRKQKSYRANSESKNIYKDKEFSKNSVINMESTRFNLITRRDQAGKPTGAPGQFGYCGKVNGISDFKNVSILTAPNFNKDYQRAYTANTQVFKKKNGDFTSWFNQMPTQGFISVPFRDK